MRVRPSRSIAFRYKRSAPAPSPTNARKRASISSAPSVPAARVRSARRCNAVAKPSGRSWSRSRTVWQYRHGVPDETRVSPDGYGRDNYYLGRDGADAIQLDLFLDYASNVALYPTFQKYFRTSRPPLLAGWGRNDLFFLPVGAEAFKRDIPDAEVRFVDTGHFALEAHVEEIAAAIRQFLT